MQNYSMAGIRAAILAAAMAIDPSASRTASMANAVPANRIFRRGEWVRKPTKRYRINGGTKAAERYLLRIEAGKIPENHILRNQ